MINITSGMITESIVNEYLNLLEEFEGDIYKALQVGYNRYGYNVANATEHNDSWFEALARWENMKLGNI